VYGWIWRKLPFGTPGRLTGTLLLATATFLLLWFVAFPAVDPHLPFMDSGVTGDAGVPATPSAVPSTSTGPSPTLAPKPTLPR
jgi:hypothetical protein